MKYSISYTKPGVVATAVILALGNLKQDCMSETSLDYTGGPCVNNRMLNH